MSAHVLRNSVVSERRLHSNAYQSPNCSDDSQQVKENILKAALRKIEEFGWTEDALVAGAAECGLPSISHGLFDRGGADLVIYFYNSNNEDFVRTCGSRKNLAGGSHAALKRFFAEAIKERLMLNTPLLEWWASGLGILAQPRYAREAMRLVGQLVDEMWYLSGDTTVDSNWYGKRAALAAVYNATELHMLQDKSDGFVDTWEFLDRQLDAYLWLHSRIDRVQEPLSNTLPLLNAGVTTIANLTGLNQRRHF
ncbi:ubiquinone biosynthesis protein COQ9-B, mitochondrial-like isoform X2 [Paramacrobiotus metropolitanus]|nr:ubiquinone biosynthesis protein COQ9-B, mitochondrial-like isoform X2 [Paramacrobiotus metropolitanus]